MTVDIIFHLLDGGSRLRLFFPAGEHQDQG